jgi:hypothetical protein
LGGSKASQTPRPNARPSAQSSSTCSGEGPPRLAPCSDAGGTAVEQTSFLSLDYTLAATAGGWASLCLPGVACWCIIAPFACRLQRVRAQAGKGAGPQAALPGAGELRGHHPPRPQSPHSSALAHQGAACLPCTLLLCTTSAYCSLGFLCR